MMAELFAGMGRELLIEYVPPTDPRVAEKTTGYIPPWWNQNCFEGAFGAWYELRSQTILEPTERELYHYCRRR
jgi:hypothetical protein